MKSYTILLFLGLIMLNDTGSSSPSLARAGVTVQDLGEEVEKSPEESRRKRIPKGSSRTPEEREKMKREKKELKDKLEACLVISRSYYHMHQDQFDSYLSDHKSTQGMKLMPPAGITPDMPKELQDEIRKGQNNHSMLLSKINGQMLLQCEEKIKPQQIQVLQRHRAHPEGFDSLQQDYSKLVDINIAVNDDAGLTGVKLDGVGKVVYSNPESRILQQIEDINSTLTREQAEYNKKKGKKVGLNVGFFDSTSLSEGQQLLLLIGVLGGIMGTIYHFYNRTLLAPDHDEAERKARKEQKKANKKNK